MNTYPQSPIPISYSNGREYYINFTQYRNLKEQAKALKPPSNYVEFSYRNITTAQKNILRDFYRGQEGQFKAFTYTDWVTGAEYEARFESDMSFSLQSYDRWNSGNVVVRLLGMTGVMI